MWEMLPCVACQQLWIPQPLLEKHQIQICLIVQHSEHGSSSENPMVWVLCGVHLDGEHIVRGVSCCGECASSHGGLVQRTEVLLSVHHLVAPWDKVDHRCSDINGARLLIANC